MKLFKIFVLLLLSWTVFLKTPWAKEQALSLTQTFLMKEIGLKLEAVRVELQFPMTITLYEGKLFDDGEKVLQFERGNFEFFGAMKGKFLFEKVQVKELVLPTIEGNVNFAEHSLLYHIWTEGFSLKGSFLNGSGPFSLNGKAKLQGNFSYGNHHWIQLQDLEGVINGWTLHGALAVDDNLKWQESVLTFENENAVCNLELNGELLQTGFKATLTSGKIFLEGNGILTQEEVHGEGTVAFQQTKIPLKFHGDWDRGLYGESEFDLALLNPYLSGSVVSGQSRMHFTWDSRGILLGGTLEKGEYDNIPSGIRLTDFQGEWTGNQESIAFINFVGKDPKKGSITASGTVRLEPEKNFPFQFQATLKKLHLLHLERAKGRCSGDLTLAGTFDRCKLSGSLNLDEGKVSIKESKREAPVTLNVTFLHGDRELLSQERMTWDGELDLKLKISNTLEVKGRGLQSRWDGEIFLRGTFDSPYFKGLIECQKGKFTLAGKTFQIKEGEVSFLGPFDRSTLYGMATTEVEGRKIDVVLSGHLNEPQILFRSNPPMSQKEIVSYILFNKGAAQISSSEKLEIAQTLATLSSSGSNGPLAKIQKAVGIDRIDVTSNPQGDTKVSLGKLIGKDTLLLVSRQFSRDANRTSEANHVGIESKIRGNLRLQVEVSDESTGQINLLWKKDY
jgi:hypothetical protein